MKRAPKSKDLKEERVEQQRELITAQEIHDQYLPFSTSTILHGECGTHVLTRVESRAPGKQRGRVLFIRSEVEKFAKDLIEDALARKRRFERRFGG